MNDNILPVAYPVMESVMCYSDCSNMRQRIRLVGESLNGVLIVPPGAGRTTLPPEATGKVWEAPFVPTNLFKLVKLVRSYRGKISAWHHPVSNEVTFFRGFVLSLFSGVPIILGCWDPPANVVWNKHDLFSKFRQWVLKRAMNLSIAHTAGSIITHHPGFWESKCSMRALRKIHFFPDGTTYWKNRAAAEGKTPVHKRFALACRVSELKGCWQIAEYFIKLYQVDHEVSLVWIGGGKEKEVRQYMIDHGVPGDLLIMPGNLEREETLPNLVTASYSLNLYPPVESLRWNYLIKSPEALSLGQPIITYDLPGSLEYAREGVTGIVVPYDDVDEAVRRTVALINDPETSAHMRQNALDLAPTYDWHKINDDMAVCIREILNEKKGGIK